MVGSATAIVGFVLVVFAALSDSRSYYIPNRLTAGVALTAAVSFLRPSVDLTFLALHLGSALLILAIGFTLFARDLFGGGDVKLLTALALWTGFADLPRLLLVTTLAGGLLALGILLWRRWRLASGGVIDQRLPYGIAIAAGGIDFCIRQLGIFQP
jgi:prepilin peptidase CpaA